MTLPRAALYRLPIETESARFRDIALLQDPIARFHSRPIQSARITKRTYGTLSLCSRRPRKRGSAPRFRPKSSSPRDCHLLKGGGGASAFWAMPSDTSDEILTIGITFLSSAFVGFVNRIHIF
jgi:hypothetical protein